MSWSRERVLNDLRIFPKQQITTGTGEDILCRMWGILNPDPGRVWNIRIQDAAKIAASDLCRFHNAPLAQTPYMCFKVVESKRLNLP